MNNGNLLEREAIANSPVFKRYIIEKNPKFLSSKHCDLQALSNEELMDYAF